ncbi:serine hydrolase domain-containing protein [Rossellomorea oryzaecorticis]|uniref:Serine hydrolase domain-containing protein n=1 Tax=Rossellomorea oryzaecorticis TaxID=1396505 RepID=A0ABW8VN35_9BACI|nr:beta-lactamase family protein [Bacillus haikouensis]
MNKVQEQLISKECNEMQSLYRYVKKVKDQIFATASSVYIIQGNEVIGEWYEGKDPSSYRKIDENTRFNVFSVRKSYIGLATAIMLHEGKIKDIDDAVSAYLGDNDLWEGITIRHLVTHTHGLNDDFPDVIKSAGPGTVWEYNGAGLSLLYKILMKVSGTTVSEILKAYVFNPLQLRETGWESEPSLHLTADVNEQNQPSIRLEDPTGFEKNLFVSTRELAHWGYFHLHNGRIGQKQVLPAALFEMTTSIQTPVKLKNTPENGFFWFRNENQYEKSELGEEVPQGSYQILGASGCTCLVIPKYDAVAVRMYNKRGNPPGYDYLRDIKNFGNIVNSILMKRMGE